MAGLARVMKLTGGLVAKDKDRVVVHKWDYEKDQPYIEAEMTREDYERQQQKDSKPGR